MDSEQNQQRIKLIYRMLLEIINGNLAYRIPLEGIALEAYNNAFTFAKQKRIY